MYFYELHEGDEEIFTDLLLVHDEQFEPEDFFELVQAVRAKVQDTFEEDTLIEAIALELEREHGFTFVSDARLSASVHVSPDREGEPADLARRRDDRVAGVPHAVRRLRPGRRRHLDRTSGLTRLVTARLSG